MGLTVGFRSGAQYDVAHGTREALQSILLVGLVVTAGLRLGVAWLLFAVARTWLWATRRLPWRLLTFLETAHHRGVLRRSGALYQFRHVEIQSYVAGEVLSVHDHRQRPATAAGVTFLNLEDETGMLNIVIAENTWNRYRRTARTSPALLIRGLLESASGVLNLVADQLRPLPIATRPTSRDFR